jgi:hypothetical protein
MRITSKQKKILIISIIGISIVLIPLFLFIYNQEFFIGVVENGDEEVDIQETDGWDDITWNHIVGGGSYVKTTKRFFGRDNVHTLHASENGIVKSVGRFDAIEHGKLSFDLIITDKPGIRIFLKNGEDIAVGIWILSAEQYNDVDDDGVYERWGSSYYLSPGAPSMFLEHHVRMEWYSFVIEFNMFDEKVEIWINNNKLYDGIGLYGFSSHTSVDRISLETGDALGAKNEYVDYHFDEFEILSLD